MPELELLFWGAQTATTNRPWIDMAVNHALITRRDILRADSSSFHLVDYNKTTGALIKAQTWQGYADTSTWSRGQAWAVYGYTLAYRYTQRADFLEAAIRTADYFLTHLPDDAIPNWDFQAPNDSANQHKDSSAAAVVASALLELKAYVTDSQRQNYYFQMAKKILKSLSMDYLASNPFPAGVYHQGILIRAVGALPHNKEVDVSTIYGDYYYLELLTRYRNPQTIPSLATLTQ